MSKMRKRRLGLLGLWILSLTAISFYGGAVSYGFFFGITLLPVISLVYLALVYWRFRIYQKVESRNMVCGQPMPYFFVLQNDDYCPFASISVRLFSSFSYVEKLPDDTEYELLPGDKYTYETKLVCKYRGEYEVGVKEIMVTDFFRLFKFTYRIPGTIKAIVQPKVTRLAALNSIGNLSVLLQRDTSLADTEPDVVVRDYIAGDALKQIHWKATAREQKLKIRNRTGEEKQGIALFCDTKRYSRHRKEYLPVENKLLEIMLALGIFLAEKNMAFTAYYGQNGMTKKRVDGIGDFDSFYEGMSRVIYSDDENFMQTLTYALEKNIISENRVIFCVLHELTEELMRMTAKMAESGILVVLYVVTEANLEEYLRQSNERRKIIVISVEAELEGRL